MYSVIRAAKNEIKNFQIILSFFSKQYTQWSHWFSELQESELSQSWSVVV